MLSLVGEALRVRWVAFLDRIWWDRLWVGRSRRLSMRLWWPLCSRLASERSSDTTPARKASRLDPIRSAAIRVKDLMVVDFRDWT